MALYAGLIEADGRVAHEVQVDDRVCDCCQTACAVLDDGTVVIAYRDRSEDERRDISIRRGRLGRAAGGEQRDEEREEEFEEVGAFMAYSRWSEVRCSWVTSRAVRGGVRSSGVARRSQRE